MRRVVVAFSCLALIGLGLTGCGINRFEQRDAWRTQAEETCLAQKQVIPSAYMALAPEINGPGTCGITHPFKVAAFAGGSVSLKQNVTLGCPMIPRIDTWLNEVVQPAASLYFGTTVAEVRSGSYSCRSRNNQRGARLSEHSFGNAVDVMAFRLEDGREIAVAKGWRGAEVEQEFLREIFVGACTYFTTVLGPGSDAFHYDHFHLDLARHDPRGERHICKPIIKFTPRLEAGAEPGPARVRALPAPRPAPVRVAPAEEPIDAEEDDPFEAAPTTSRAPPQTTRLASERPAQPAPAPRASPLPPARPPMAYARSAQAAPAPLPREPVVLQPHLSTSQPIY